jgi:hypothetical protein
MRNPQRVRRRLSTLAGDYNGLRTTFLPSPDDAENFACPHGGLHDVRSFIDHFRTTPVSNENVNNVLHMCLTSAWKTRLFLLKTDVSSTR